VYQYGLDFGFVFIYTHKRLQFHLSFLYLCLDRFFFILYIDIDRRSRENIFCDIHC